MTIGISRYNINIYYNCYKLPFHGKRCPDRNTSKCFTCKYCKAEMSAANATKLLNAYGRRTKDV